jgi:hypothetical protein
MRLLVGFRCHHTATAAVLIPLLFFAPGCSSRTQGARGVRIATYTQGSLTALPLILAERLGYFKAENLAVTIDETPSGTKAIQALLGGSDDVASAFHELASFAKEDYRYRELAGHDGCRVFARFSHRSFPEVLTFPTRIGS